MIQLAIIIVIIISLVAGIYAIFLLAALRRKYQLDFLNSFFYYQILFFLFGLYGILGNLAVQQILLKYDLNNSNIGAIALFFPFFGVPFIIAAWYLLIKLSAELIHRKVHQYIAVAYFILTTTIFLIYGNFMQKMPDYDYHDLTKKVIVVFYIIDIIVSGNFFLAILLNSMKEKLSSRHKYLIRFGMLVLALSILRAISMHFANYHWIIGLYFLLLFFAGNLATILLTKVYLSKYHSDYQIPSPNITDIFLKYSISNREKEIIHEICKGKTNQQIADDLFISLQTVKDHTYNIFRKTNVKNRVQLTTIFNSLNPSDK
jgi:DNA-binding CsgD family transcriptional regulator